MGCVDMENTVTGTPVTPDLKRLVSGPCHDVPCEQQWTHCVFWSVEELQCFKHAL